jgi:acyl-[acyl carrier protein]--UDP-N-acetylglucosamine O-acyltransferase
LYKLLIASYDINLIQETVQSRVILSTIRCDRMVAILPYCHVAHRCDRMVAILPYCHVAHRCDRMVAILPYYCHVAVQSRVILSTIYTGIWYIQVKLTKISYVCDFIKVQFRQVSLYIKVRLH